MAKKNVLIKTGEAARLLGVSTQTLRAWHRKGILVPDFLPESGTRMYSIRQINSILEGRHGQRNVTPEQQERGEANPA
jgi:DNA-binding transcriptional MerR regulator